MPRFNPPYCCISILIGFCKDKALASGQLDLSHTFVYLEASEAMKMMLPDPSRGIKVLYISSLPCSFSQGTRGQ